MSLPGLDGMVRSEPCDGGRGGDVYFVSACSSGMFARVCLADVVGHGERVAEMSDWLHRTLRARINQHDAARIFASVNRHVIARGYSAITTAACVTFNAKRGELNYCYAGHPPVLRYSAREEQWSPLQLETPRGGLRNLAFGVAEETVYDVGRCILDPGDRLLIYSDGLTETPDPRRELFGEDRLLAFLKECPGPGCDDAVDALVEALCRHAGASELAHDDVTLLMFEAGPRLTGSLLWLLVRNRIRRWHIHHEAAPSA